MYARVVLCASLLATQTVHASPRVLRIASVVPAGTPWARELQAFANEVKERTHEQVTVKLILGGIAGDELRSLERTRAGQLDGLVGAAVCEKLSPTLRVMRLAGMFRSRAEERAVVARLQTRIEREMEDAGFVLLGLASLGADVAMTRRPVSSLDDLRAQKLWFWNDEEVAPRVGAAMGLRVVPLPLDEAAAAYDNGKVDGFMAVPTAALAFQWSIRARYFSRLGFAILPDCIVVDRGPFFRIAVENRNELLAAGAKLSVRSESVTASIDDALLDGLFAKQGMVEVPVTTRLRAEFFAAARAGRDAVQIPADLMKEVTGYLADYRAEHPSQ
jgi:TRAP-type C4-dicarboxylate transport system substrate-binding protein